MFFLTWAASAVEIPVGADAHVSSIAPQVTAGTSPTLNLNGTSRIYLRFPLSGQIPAGTVPAQIATAWLHVWPNRVDQPGSFQIVPAGANWDESTITLANAPATASSPVATGIAVFAKSPVRVDVTILVQQALTNGNADLNLALVPLAGTAVYFDSKENTATSHMPVIEIEIAGPMTTGTDRRTRSGGRGRERRVPTREWSGQWRWYMHDGRGLRSSGVVHQSRIDFRLVRRIR
jgi:hypothetical protein